MYSNKMINAFFFFFFFLFIIIQCFAPLISACGSQLSVDYYEKSCPDLDDIVVWGVWNVTKFDPRMPASLLRLFFHDCFVNGCDASVLLDATLTMKSEKNAGPNINSLRGFEVIDQIKAAVEKECPKIVSCADILALAARAAVIIALYEKELGWPESPWDVELGRYDGMTANMTGANSNLPSPTEPIDTIINKFLAHGLDTKDMVVLSGAHTIGSAKCSTIKGNRLYPSSSSYKRKNNYEMDVRLLWELRTVCRNVKLTDNYTIPLDWNTTYAFDNDYYGNLLENKGILLSDQALLYNQRTSGWVKIYSNDPKLFMKDFGDAMVKMSNISVITKGGKVKGEIRNKCSSTN